MIAAILTLLALLAPFVFPWSFSLAIAFVLSLFVPFGGIAVGLLADALYYSPQVSRYPWATIAASIGALIAYGVRRFTKTRIITG